MEDSALSFKISNKFSKSLDQFKFQIKGFCVIFYGQTQKKVCQGGVKTREVLASFLEVISFLSFWVTMILI